MSSRALGAHRAASIASAQAAWPRRPSEKFGEADEPPIALMCIGAPRRHIASITPSASIRGNGGSASSIAQQTM